VKLIITHRSTLVDRRRPLASDALIDYEKDSDEEYEEEKEGEDLNSNAEDEEGAEEAAESEADSFFVSDGHFSEDEALSDDEAVVARKKRQEMRLDSEGKATLQLITFSPADLMAAVVMESNDSSSDPCAAWLVLLASEAVITVLDPLNYFNAEPEDEKKPRKKEAKPAVTAQKPVIDWATVRPDLAKFIHGKTTNIDSLCAEFKVLQPDLSANAIRTEIRTMAAWTKKPEFNSRVAWYVKADLFEQLGLTEQEMAALIQPSPPVMVKEMLRFEPVVSDREIIHN
jgi:chromatin assembly factor 1 subunit A